jgi:hypothetical protein
MLAGPQVDGAPARAIVTGTIKRVPDIQPHLAVEVALVAKTIERLADDALDDLDPVPVACFPGMANLANVVHVEQIDQ